MEKERRVSEHATAEAREALTSDSVRDVVIRVIGESVCRCDRAAITDGTLLENDLGLRPFDRDRLAHRMEAEFGIPAGKLTLPRSVSELVSDICARLRIE